MGLAFAIAAMLTIGGFGSGLVSAQDATPEGMECVETTVEENIALVTSATAAMDAADAEAIDTAFADTFTNSGSRFGIQDDATTNDDEVALAGMLQTFYPGASTTIDDAFSLDDNHVAVLSTFTITEHTLTGESVALDEPLAIAGVGVFTIECGEIASADSVLDSLTLLEGVGVLQGAEMDDAMMPSPEAAMMDGSPMAEECAVTSVEENIAIATEAGEAIDAADADKIDELFADSYTDIGSRFGLPVDETTNDDEHNMAMMIQQLYPGATTTVDEIWGVDNRVVYIGTFNVDSHTATGEETVLDETLSVTSVAVLTIECGEIVEADSLIDTLALLEGIGVLQSDSDMATPEA